MLQFICISYITINDIKIIIENVVYKILTYFYIEKNIVDQLLQFTKAKFTRSSLIFEVYKYIV